MMGVTQKPLASKEVQAKSDADLKKVILEGQGKMKPVAGVTAKQADDVVAYVRTMK
jgi:DNA-binding protein YbaB